MKTDQTHLKTLSIAALAVMSILLIGAIVFFKERLFADTSFILYSIINNQALYIQEHRYGSFITQMVPYFGLKLHLSLKTIAVAYTISFNVFYLLVAGLLIFRLRQYGLAILMALYYLLFVSDSYFWPINEIHQAVAWMFLFFGVLLHAGRKQTNFILFLALFLLAFLTISTHFVVIIPTTFLWVYLIIEKELWPFSGKISIVLSTLLVAIFIAKYFQASEHSYDSAHLHGLTHFSLQDIIDSFSTPVVEVFLIRCLNIYWLATIIFLISVITLIRNKKYWLLAWTVISVAGYLIVMGLTYGSLDEHVLLCHIESEWACISIIIATPFIFSFLPQLKPLVSTILLIGIFLIRLSYIGAAIPKFVWRTHFQEKVFAQMKRKGIYKLALYNDNPIREKMLLDWALPHETILNSAMNGDNPQRTFFFINKDDKQNIEKVTGGTWFWDAYNMTPSKYLNNVYFNTDTTHPYQLMTTTDFFK